MRKAELTIPDLLDKLERFYGKQAPCWPVDPYEFIVWWQCGYPASDAACTKGWDKLKSEVGIEPHNLLAATSGKLTSALKAGGMVPELRALRLKEIAMRVTDEFGGDLRAALVGPLSKARKTLKKFPCIADPGADRILVFAGITPVAAVPSIVRRSWFVSCPARNARTTASIIAKRSRRSPWRSRRPSTPARAPICY